jgi:DNA-binding PadR family transcriptional regulator
MATRIIGGLAALGGLGFGCAPTAALNGILTDEKISSYSSLMRRRTGELVPLEVSILEASVELAGRGKPEAHGFLLAKEIRDREAARRLTAYGTLYKALDRLERVGYLASRWEDPMVAAAESRPRRRFYRTTAIGEQALVEAHRSVTEPGGRRPAAAQP